MGVLDNGTVLGVPPKAAQDMVKNFISAISNPLNFTPTIYLVPEILIYEGKTVIHVHIPASAGSKMNRHFRKYPFLYHCRTA